MTAIMGRMATYSGQQVEWDDCFNCKVGLMPQELTWESRPPVMPEADGSYPQAHPGITIPCEDFANPNARPQA
jgi:hypothetical protein